MDDHAGCSHRPARVGIGAGHAVEHTVDCAGGATRPRHPIISAAEDAPCAAGDVARTRNRAREVPQIGAAADVGELEVVTVCGAEQIARGSADEHSVAAAGPSCRHKESGVASDIGCGAPSRTAIRTA